ncbi:MAG: hypothetical protein J6D03_01205 [Clostridia bacterium]|nr:hypothetical protein [Clostridia bacterium]
MSVEAKSKRKHNIKHIKPQKNSRYEQGYINPSSCKKLFEAVRKEPIIYRSGLELKYIHFFEQCPGIRKWASEPFNIEYFSRLDNSMKNYYPDFILEKTNGDVLLVEIKPDDQTHKPSSISNNWAKESWIRNTDKWSAAKEFAEKRGMKFIILTEKFLN